MTTTQKQHRMNINLIQHAISRIQKEKNTRTYIVLRNEPTANRTQKSHTHTHTHKIRTNQKMKQKPANSEQANKWKLTTLLNYTIKGTLKLKISTEQTRKPYSENTQENSEINTHKKSRLNQNTLNSIQKSANSEQYSVSSQQ